mgnify:CR=1 FL=1
MLGVCSMSSVRGQRLKLKFVFLLLKKIYSLVQFWIWTKKTDFLHFCKNLSSSSSQLMIVSSFRCFVLFVNFKRIFSSFSPPFFLHHTLYVCVSVCPKIDIRITINNWWCDVCCVVYLFYRFCCCCRFFVVVVVICTWIVVVVFGW